MPDVVICQTQRWATFFVDELGLDAERCVVVENWSVTDSHLRIGDARHHDEHTRQGSVVTVLFVGALEVAKGVLDLLEAVHLLRERRGLPKWRMTFVGAGSLEGVLADKVVEMGWEDLVEVRGPLSSEAVLDEMRRADLFVLPSRTEGLPNALLEAMGAGLPVIATPVGGIPDVVDDGVQGLMVEPGAPGALAASMEKLISSPRLRRELGAASHELAGRRFAVEVGARGLSDVLTAALRCRRPPRRHGCGRL